MGRERGVAERGVRVEPRDQRGGFALRNVLQSVRQRDGETRLTRELRQRLARPRDAVEAGEGAKVAIVVNQSPFYAESGGQVGDHGLIRTDTGAARVTDTKKVAGVFIHQAEVTMGTISRGQGAQLSVDHDRRSAIRAIGIPSVA